MMKMMMTRSSSNVSSPSYASFPSSSCERMIASSASMIEMMVHHCHYPHHARYPHVASMSASPSSTSSSDVAAHASRNPMRPVSATGGG